MFVALFIDLAKALIDSNLLLNSKKTKAMLFAPKSASSCLSVDTLDGVSVEFVDTYKYTVWAFGWTAI